MQEGIADVGIGTGSPCFLGNSLCSESLLAASMPTVAAAAAGKGGAAFVSLDVPICLLPSKLAA